MGKLGIWLYRYMLMHASHVLHHAVAVLGAMVSSPPPKPALQRVRTPVPPSISDIRLRSDFLTPWI